VPIQENTGAGGPTGVVVYEGSLLPEYHGCVFDCDAGRNVVRIHKPVADGGRFKFEKSALIEAKAPSTQPSQNSRWNWFRPSDVAIGTDGAVYVADWYDPGVGGHNVADKEGFGRIFRIAPKSDRTRPPKIDFDSVDGQIDALMSPAVNIRYLAANELAARWRQRDAEAAGGVCGRRCGHEVAHHLGVESLRRRRRGASSSGCWETETHRRA
jgi:hypothetical protein